MASGDTLLTPVVAPAGGQKKFKPADLPLWQRAVLFSLAFLVCAEVGKHLSVPGGTSSSFWLPAGLGSAVLLLNPTRDWPWLLLALPPANFIFDYAYGSSPVLILFFVLANVVQSFLGAWMVRRWIAERPALTSLKEFFGLMGLIAGVSTIPSTAIGVSILSWYGLVHGPLGLAVLEWWGSTAMAVLVLTPFILTWFDNSRDSRAALQFRNRPVEAGLLFLGLAASLVYVLGWDKGILSQYRAFVIPFLLWAGLRFGRRGAATVNLLLALTLAFFTTQYSLGLTPAEFAAGDYVFILQLVLAMAVLIALVPAIVLYERDLTLLSLRDSEERFRQLTQAAFEGICLSENGRIIDANDQLLRMFGYEHQEMIGREVITLVAPENQAAVAEDIRTHRAPVYKQPLQRKDGSVFDAEVRVKIVPIGRRTIRMAAIRDLSDRKHAEIAREQAEARERQARLNYTLQLIAYQEAERTRIATELHDSLGQNLLIIKNRSQLALLDGHLAPSDREHLEAIGSLTTEAIAEVRQISYDLHPYQLDHLGLTQAIEAMVDHAREGSDITFTHKLDNVDQLFSKELALSLYRIIQESLSNVFKHSHAKNAAIRLERDVHTVVLTIEDDGEGYDAAVPPENSPGLGLKNIAGRVRLLGGRLAIDSLPGRGTRLVLTIPVAET